MIGLPHPEAKLMLLVNVHDPDFTRFPVPAKR
jgi:hypothetical protein